MLRCKTTNHSGASGCSLQAQEDAVKAIQALDGLDWRSRTLKISQNKSRGSEGKAGLILESFTIIQPFFFARNLLPGPAEVDASGRPAAVGSLVQPSRVGLPFQHG